MLGVDFTKEELVAIGGAPVPNQCVGDGRLHINDKTVAELAGMHTQVGKFALCGEGLNIGRDGSGNVTDDYPGVLPWAFHGGTITRVIVDVIRRGLRRPREGVDGNDEPRLIDLDCWLRRG